MTHPNVLRFGKTTSSRGNWICMDMLQQQQDGDGNHYMYKGWTAGYSILSILMQLQSFLMKENIGDLNNNDINKMRKESTAFKCQQCPIQKSRKQVKIQNGSDMTTREEEIVKNVDNKADNQNVKFTITTDEDEKQSRLELESKEKQCPETKAHANIDITLLDDCKLLRFFENFLSLFFLVLFVLVYTIELHLCTNLVLSLGKSLN